LYSLKTTFEQTQLMLSKDAANRAQLKIVFAEERLEEISKLVKEGRYLEIKQTVLDFETAINGALFEVEAVTKSDPVQAAQLASAITASLTKYAEVLTGLAASVPEVIQAEVNRALESALLAGSLDMSSDDNSNDNDMNSNDNDTNSNDDDMNSNDDDDDDMNSNDNDDDDMNSNDNDDDDMNSYDDDDDDMNGNNDNDDDSNSNDDDSNSNDDDSNSNDDDSNSNDDDSNDSNENDDFEDDND